MGMTPSVRSLLPAAVALLGCSGVLGPVPDGKQLAIIGPGPTPNDFPGIPDTVNAGPTTIRYNTYGSSSCNRPAGEGIETESTVRVTFTAYDEEVPSGAVCTADFVTFNRTVTVTLSPGQVRLVLRGLQFGGGRTPAEIARTVIVR
ncbi:MAG: hypothetical protein FJ206_11570 [Gemmatimonadetes bacterium]|nr:hypothetical protein [Gemmatimonadota bacterium]